MKEITIEEKKRISLEILDVIHDFCEKNGIKYYLAYGSLLGAVRHKGFIPWDDDIDLVMLRPEYELFQKLFNVDGYTFVNEETKNIFPLVFGKVFANSTFGVYNGIPMNYGVAVDIFPLDGLPSDENEMLRLYRKQQKNYINFSRYVSGLLLKDVRSIKDLILKIYSKIIPLDFLKSNIVKTAKTYRYDNSNMIAPLQCLNINRFEKCNVNCYNEQVDLLFEGKKYKAPVGYDEVLKSFYGEDYMTPPPETQRITNHDEQYFWIEGNDENE